MAKNTFYDYITGKQSVPASVVQTGTLETQGTNVIGTGTAFSTEMPAGSWLIDLTQNEVRYVYRVDSDTQAFISEAFTSDLAASSDVDVISKSDADCISISVQIVAGSGAGELDGKVFPDSTSVTFDKSGRDHSGKRDMVNPIIVDATGTEMQVVIIR